MNARGAKGASDAIAVLLRPQGSAARLSSPAVSEPSGLEAARCEELTSGPTSRRLGPFAPLAPLAFTSAWIRNRARTGHTGTRTRAKVAVKPEAE